MPEKILKWFIPYVMIQSLGFYFAKNSLNYSSPYVFMAMRYLLAAGLLLFFSRRVLVNKWTGTIAAFTSFSTLTWILGLRYVSPGDSAVLNSTGPLFAIPLAVVIVRERPVIWEVIGALVGFSGVLIYSVTLSHGSLLEGTVLSLLAAMTWACFSVLFRKTRNEDPASIVGSQYLLGSVPFIFGALLFSSVQINQNFLIDLVYTAVPGGAVQLYLWNRMLQVEDVAKITTMTFAIPALTTAIQSLETVALPNPTAIVGALVMFVGVYISSRSRLAKSRRIDEKKKMMT